MSKERPMLFSAPMIRALLNGNKTQTRRVVKPQPPANCHQVETWHHPDARPRFFTWTTAGEISDQWEPLACPYGQPGDRLWVREAFRLPGNLDEKSPSSMVGWAEKRGYQIGAIQIQFEADGTKKGKWKESNHVTPYTGKLRPGIHMPRWASRITLGITSVRVERLQDISEADAKAEGICELPLQAAQPGCWWTADAGAGAALHGRTPCDAYRLLWDSINGPESWEANPWVWVVDFKRIEGGAA